MTLLSIILTTVTTTLATTGLHIDGLNSCPSVVASAAVTEADGTLESKETRTLDLKDFHGMEINSVCEIFYTKGNEYKVEVSGSAKAFRQTGISVEDGMLTTKQNENNGRGFNANIKMEPLTFHIISPSLDVIINVGFVTFHTSEISAADFKLGNSGDIIFDMPTLKCGSIDILNSGNLQLRCSISADTYRQKNSGNSNIKADFNIKDSFMYVNSGSTKISGKLSASHVNINNSGDFMPTLSIKADTLKSTTSGTTNADIDYKGGKADIVCSGYGDFNLKVDCQALSTFASGDLKVKITGTADNVNLDGTGTSNVDMTRLNKS